MGINNKVDMNIALLSISPFLSSFIAILASLFSTRHGLDRQNHHATTKWIVNGVLTASSLATARSEYEKIEEERECDNRKNVQNKRWRLARGWRSRLRLDDLERGIAGK
jgi:hypothetical protein